MTQQFQGKNVQRVRDAKQGDPGFAQGQDQVIITMEDGTEKTVQRKEVTEDEQGKGQSQGQSSSSSRR